MKIELGSVIENVSVLAARVSVPDPVPDDESHLRVWLVQAESRQPRPPPSDAALIVSACAAPEANAERIPRPTTRIHRFISPNPLPALPGLRSTGTRGRSQPRTRPRSEASGGARVAPPPRRPCDQEPDPIEHRGTRLGDRRDEAQVDLDLRELPGPRIREGPEV